MNNRLYSKNRVFHALNMVDSSLTAFKKKGNLGYVNELYNPENFFEQVHHVTFFPEDSSIEIENRTIKVHVLKRAANKMWHPANVLLFFLQVMRIAARNRISVVRARSAGLAGFLGLLTGKLLGIPFIISLGQDTKLLRELNVRFRRNRLSLWEALRSSFIELVEVIVIRNADFIVAPSRHLKDYATSLKVNQGKITVIPWMLKKDFLEKNVDRNELNRLKIRFNLDLEKPIILYVGRLEVEKQVDILIRAIPLVLGRKSDAQFVFIGDGSLFEWLRRQAEVLSVADQVYFLGYQSIDVVRAFLSVASVVWIPMSGYVMLEAAAFSAPIVAFDVEWHREFIASEVNGLLVENRNYVKLAEAVLKMLDDPKSARRYGEAAKHKLIEEYDPESLRRKEIAMYEKVLRQHALHPLRAHVSKRSML